MAARYLADNEAMLWVIDVGQYFSLIDALLKAISLRYYSRAD